MKLSQYQLTSQRRRGDSGRSMSQPSTSKGWPPWQLSLRRGCHFGSWRLRLWSTERNTGWPHGCTSLIPMTQQKCWMLSRTIQSSLHCPTIPSVMPCSSPNCSIHLTRRIEKPLPLISMRALYQSYRAMFSYYQAQQRWASLSAFGSEFLWKWQRLALHSTMNSRRRSRATSQISSWGKILKSSTSICCQT